MTAVIAMSAAILVWTLRTGESYTYMMGHFPAPWGNEIRAGVLEALTATIFGVVMLLSIVGGMNWISWMWSRRRPTCFSSWSI